MHSVIMFLGEVTFLLLGVLTFAGIAMFVKLGQDEKAHYAERKLEETDKCRYK